MKLTLCLGSDRGPSQIIAETAARSISATTFREAGREEFEANPSAIEPGPSCKLPPGELFSFSLEGGVAVVYVWGGFPYNEEVETPAGLMNVKGDSNNQNVEFGGYAGAKISAAIGEQSTLFAGAQWQDRRNYEHRDPATGETEVPDLSQSNFLTAGIGYSF